MSDEDWYNNLIQEEDVFDGSENMNQPLLPTHEEEEPISSRHHRSASWGFLLDSAKKLVKKGSSANPRKKDSLSLMAPPASSEHSRASDIENDRRPAFDEMSISFSSDMYMSTSCASSESNNAESTTNLTILNGRFYKIVSNADSIRIAALCLSCSAIIKGDKRSSSNFVRHLKNQHPATFNEYSNLRKSNKIDATNQQAQHQSLISDFTSKLGQPRLSPFQSAGQLHLAVENFIISGLHSLSIVEEPKFRELFTFPLVSRRTLTRRLEVRLETLRDSIRKITSDEKYRYFSSSADFWSYSTRSFLGVIAHYIDENFKRCSIPIAFKAATGSHSHDRIAQWLSSIFQRYNLDTRKLVGTTTDNASNIEKCFREFGVELSATVVQVTHVTSDEEMAEDEDDTFLLEDVNFPCWSSEIDHHVWSLPPHFHCPAHKLSLISSSDFMKIINQNEILKEKHASLIDKANQLWKAARRPLSAEIITDTLGVNLKCPVVTRWNSLYDSLVHLVKHESKLMELVENLNAGKKEKEKLPHFSVADLSFMKFLTEIQKPVAIALDLLQGDTMYGETLPAIHSLYQHLEQLLEAPENCISYKRYLIRGLLDSMMARETRFRNLLNLNYHEDYETKVAILAAVSHPKFKNRFIRRRCPVSLQVVNDLFFYALKDVDEERGREKNVSQVEPTDVLSSESSSFFILNDSTVDADGSSSSDDGIKIEMLSYLKDSRTQFDMLHEYKRVKEVFFKFNTPMPSSAPVERFFSYSSIITRAKRFYNDEHFEMIMLLNKNSVQQG